LVESKSEAKRLVEQGGVEIDNKRILNSNESIALKNDMLIKVGKRRIVKLSTST
jgi:tyrosyl-tRNA synthetase